MGFHYPKARANPKTLMDFINGNQSVNILSSDFIKGKLLLTEEEIDLGNLEQYLDRDCLPQPEDRSPNVGVYIDTANGVRLSDVLWHYYLQGEEDDFFSMFPDGIRNQITVRI